MGQQDVWQQYVELFQDVWQQYVELYPIDISVLPVTHIIPVTSKPLMVSQCGYILVVYTSHFTLTVTTHHWLELLNRVRTLAVNDNQYVQKSQFDF